MTLLDLFQAVKEKNLTKTQLEDYHTDLTNLYAQMLLEMAELEKREAMYFLDNKEKGAGKGGIGGYANESTIERSDVEIKRMWRGTELGQRLIELKNYEKATSKVLSSIKNRIYAQL